MEGSYNLLEESSSAPTRQHGKGVGTLLYLSATLFVLIHPGVAGVYCSAICLRQQDPLDPQHPIMKESPEWLAPRSARLFLLRDPAGGVALKLKSAHERHRYYTQCSILMQLR